MFVDQVTTTIHAGKGGNGCVSFRREYRVPRGGPNGGKGGDGGNVWLISESRLNSLVYYRFHPINKARNGAHGEGSNRYGKNGKDLELRVPVGTVVKLKDRNDVLFDFVKPGQRYLAAKGGRGGRGNASFATSTHQAPREFEEGAPGEEKDLVLELKLIADVGLVGFPNVGKSTLISKISSAKPVIADYPFTTLAPNLGVVDAGEKLSFVVADIPGLIEGAHRGHGLGDKFLKHIERTKILLHIIDVSPYTQRNPVEDFQVIMKELEAYNPQLARRPQIVVANKIDLLSEDDTRLKALAALARRKKLRLFPVSAMKRQGLKPLVNALASKILDLEKKANDKESHA